MIHGIFFVVAIGLLGVGPQEAPRPDGGPSAPEPMIAEAIVKAGPAQVWRVFATAEGFKKLGVAQCELDLRVGGHIRSHYDPKGVLGDDGTIENEILSFEPDRMISFRIHKPPKGFPFPESAWKATWSVVTLTDLGDGRTHVRLAGMGYTDAEESRKMRKWFEQGNAWTLKRLAHEFDASEAPPSGPAHQAATTAPVLHERVVDLPRGEAWDLLATSAGWKRFFGVEARIDLVPGGPFEILFGSDAPKGQQGSEGCTVLSVVPGRMLSFTWNAPPKFGHARTRHTWVVVHFDDLAPGRTRVRLDHLGFAEQASRNPDHRAEWEQVRAYFESAWGKVLDAVKSQARGK